jgi:hypothetical protein
VRYLIAGGHEARAYGKSGRGALLQSEMSDDGELSSSRITIGFDIWEPYSGVETTRGNTGLVLMSLALTDVDESSSQIIIGQSELNPRVVFCEFSVNMYTQCHDSCESDKTISLAKHRIPLSHLSIVVLRFECGRYRYGCSLVNNVHFRKIKNSMVISVRKGISMEGLKTGQSP